MVAVVGQGQFGLLVIRSSAMLSAVRGCVHFAFLENFLGAIGVVEQATI